MDAPATLKQRQREEVVVFKVSEYGESKVCIAETVEDAIFEASNLLLAGKFGVTVCKGRMHPDDIRKLPPCTHD